jgi:hypothetical protein
LGAHNIKEQEKTQQVIPMVKCIPHPDYNPKTFSNDIMLLKVRPVPVLVHGLPLLLSSSQFPPFHPGLHGVSDQQAMSWTLASSPTAEE